MPGFEHYLKEIVKYVVFWASLVAQIVKNLPAMKEMGLIYGLERSPGEENSNPLQYSCLENPVDREAWWAMVQKVTKS